MKKLILFSIAMLFLLGLSGCSQRTVYVAYAIPPPLTASVIEPYLKGEDNDALQVYAQECRTALRICNSQLTIIRETQR